MAEVCKDYFSERGCKKENKCKLSHNSLDFIVKTVRIYIGNHNQELVAEIGGIEKNLDLVYRETYSATTVNYCSLWDIKKGTKLCQVPCQTYTEYRELMGDLEKKIISQWKIKIRQGQESFPSDMWYSQKKDGTEIYEPFWHKCTYRCCEKSHLYGDEIHSEDCNGEIKYMAHNSSYCPYCKGSCRYDSCLGRNTRLTSNVVNLHYQATSDERASILMEYYMTRKELKKVQDKFNALDTIVKALHAS